MKVGIIGAGACGIMLAGLLEKNNIDYTLFNKGKIGRKILASGNGKCNISNINYDKKYYHNNYLADKIISNNQHKLFDYFKILKIYTFNDEEGRMYPYSESSASILDIMLENVSNIIDEEIVNVHNNGNKYYLNEHGPFDYIVLASGSKASYIKSQQDYYNNYLSYFNVKINKIYPSLVGFKVKEKVKNITGVRTKGLVSLYQNDKLIHSEYGEVNFKDDGLSGICVMNLSSYYANLDSKNNCQIKIDLAHNLEFDNYKSVLNPKLYKYVLENNIDIHNMILNINGVYDFEFAQVCKGGISIEEVNDNLSLKKYNNVYVGGEIIDVDGVCGGYNLMFAFSCALEIYRSLYEIYRR